jgi:hypothetical protein
MAEHELTVAHSTKMDGRDLWQATCSCGYCSAPGSESHARMAGSAHVAAMKRFKAWYIPQVPMKAFEVEVSTAAEAKAALEMITNFSIFELENKIKPDYFDAGGVMVWDEAEHEWFDIDEEG